MCSLLALHRSVSGSITEVDTQDGVITLRGVAKSEAQRELVTAYAEDVNGVLRVTNAMSVVQTAAQADDPVFETIDDASITAQVRVGLRLHESTSSVHIQVGTIAGVVTIVGLARNEAERTMVNKLATDIRGVKSVVNHLNIRPAASRNGVSPSRVSNLRVVSKVD